MSKVCFIYLWALICEFFKSVGIKSKQYDEKTNGTVARKMGRWTDGRMLAFILNLCTSCKRNTHYIQYGLFCLVVSLLSVVSYL
jgi:hypothetical protein